MSNRVYVVYSEQRKVEPYAAAIRDEGIDPVLLKAGADWNWDHVGGLLLTGGTDVNPELYGEAPSPETDKVLDTVRDRMEMVMIGEALDLDVPIFAICRGLQILNVQHGGSLIQHLETTARHKQRTADPSVLVHSVRIEPGTRLAAISGAPHWEVNSRHHQAAGTIGVGLRVSARDPFDGVVEGLERPDKRFVVAVQWHPEDQVRAHPEQRRLFQAFGDAL